MARVLLVLGCSVAFGGCAATVPRGPLTVAPEELRALAPDLEAEAYALPHTLTARQIDRAWDVVDGAHSSFEKVRRLLHAIASDRELKLRYDPNAVGPAAAALERGTGNCMAIAAAVVGLARAVGLHAFYVEIPRPAMPASRVGTLLVRTGHIGAVIRTEHGYGGIEIGDRWVKTGHWRELTDREATAQHQNLLGYRRLLDAREAERWEHAARHFGLAIALDPTFAPAHNNLGVALSRLGRAPEALREYQEAMRLAPTTASPWSNAANVHLVRHEFAEALALLQHAAALDPDSPEIAYREGATLVALGRVPEGMRVLEHAARLAADTPDARETPAQRLLALVRAKYGPQGEALLTPHPRG